MICCTNMLLSLIHLGSLLVDEYSFMNGTWLEPSTRRCQNAQKQDLGKKGMFFFLITPKKEAVKNSRIRKFLHTFFYARHRPTAFIWSRNFSLDILCISQGRLCSFIRLDVDIPVQAVPLKMIEIPDGWFSNTFCHCKDDDLVPWRWSKKVIGNICQSFCNPGYNFPPFC